MIFAACILVSSFSGAINAALSFLAIGATKSFFMVYFPEYIKRNQKKGESDKFSSQGALYLELYGKKILATVVLFDGYTSIAIAIAGAVLVGVIILLSRLLNIFLESKAALKIQKGILWIFSAIQSLSTKNKITKLVYIVIVPMVPGVWAESIRRSGEEPKRVFLDFVWGYTIESILLFLVLILKNA